MSLSKEEAKKRIEKLRKVIDYHRYLYHVLDKPEISDTAWDSLKKELLDLERQFPEFITPDSPTQRVGGEPLKEFKKYKHSMPMLSFNDAFSEEDVRDWEKRNKKFLETNQDFEYYCELKIDGLAIELVYESGIFKIGATRGNGIIGEDVTNNLKTIEAIPLKLLEFEEVEKNLKREQLGHLIDKIRKIYEGRLEVRGEVFMSKAEFEKINRERTKKGEMPFANPRNIAAGSVRQLDPKVTASRHLDSFVYAIVTDLGQKTHEEEHKILHCLGFKTNKHNKFCQSLKEVFEFRNYWEDNKNRNKLEYEIDGVVVIINDNAIFRKLGVVGKAPRGAIAYKFSPKETTTKIKNIIVQVGRTGALTPVAILEPVSLGGVTIRHATLHNEDEIKRLGVKLGDTVIVGRAGDVIPEVREIVKGLRTGQEKNFHMPKSCPICGTKVVKDEGGVIIRCPNKNCRAKKQESLYHFVSKKAFDIVGLGPKILDKFNEEGLISDASDIFFLDKGDIEVLERFGEKSAENIMKSIEASKNIPLERFLYALGILHLGEENAFNLAKKIIAEAHIKKPSDLIKYFKNKSTEDLQQIEDFGPKISNSILEFFSDKQNQKFIEKLDAAGVRIISERPKIKNQKFAGKVFVLTGGLNSMTREEAKKRIRELGGEISSSVSKNVDYVILGAQPGEKYEKAKKLGIKILTEEQFLKILD